jgi:hypothetical protein
LTITLPNFGSDFEKSLDLGEVAQSSFAGFAKNGRLPKFLSGFTSLVFDTASGRLLDEPSIDAIHSIRQLSRLFGKVDLPCSDARVTAAIDKYVECEKQVKEADRSMDYDEFTHLQRVALLLFGNSVLAPMDRKIYEDGLLPKHGPGATADKLSGNAKWNLRMWTERLDTLFDHSNYLYPSVSHFLESEPLDLLEPGQELPVRVITVPKTLKTPRIIAIEPTCMMFMQQALLRELVKLLETSDSVSRFIGFSDQTPNQHLAREGSLSGDLATLDLSEASDRVSNQLVRGLFASYPWFSKALDVTRSRKADVPGYGVLRLAKYASMGSALCFPIEAMVFTTIVFRGIEKVLNRPLVPSDLPKFEGRVRVYGDDIIVPVDCAASVVATLEDFGLRVNADKSFWTGRFRESCGKEYYHGHDVSIVKVRRVLPTHRKHVSEIVSAVSLRNQLAGYGMERATEFLDSLIERFIPFPRVLPTSPGLGKHDLSGIYDVQRECFFLQRPLVRAAVVKSRIPSDPLEGPGALLKWFLKQGDKPFADRDHLTRAGRAESVDIKLGWVSPR